MRPTLDVVGWPVQTARLRLRRARLEDAAALFAYRRREDVSRWLARVQTSLASYTTGDFAARLSSTIVVEHEDAVIGDTRIVVSDARGQAEVADRLRGVEAELMWAFDPAFGGRGLATEAVRAVIEIAFLQLGLRRLVAVCYAENEPSWRLMERVGMRRESVQIASRLHRDGTWKDFYGYALLAEEAEF